MRAIPMLLLAAGCCELGLGDDCDAEPSEDPATQGVERPESQLDLAVPTDNPVYDRYTRQVMDLDLLSPPSTPAQLSEGLTGLQEVPAGIPRGSVFTRIDPNDATGWHRVEHWFVSTPPESYVPSVPLEAQFLATTLWAGAEAHLAAEQPDWPDQTYLCMDLHYKASVDALPGLGYEGPELQRWTFDVLQGPGDDVVASLLRERHDHPSLGEVFVDFWSFQPAFAFVGEGADSLTLQPTGVLPPPPMDWIALEPPNQLFVRTLYRVQAGADFDLATSATGCPE